MKAYWAIGLMSGTSLDGIDAALIRSDGERILAMGESLTLPYDEELRRRLRGAVYGNGDISLVMRDMTLAHAEAVHQLLAKTSVKPEVIGFHGQSIDHRPDKGITLQIADPALLAEKTGIDVVSDFRRRDVAAGGQGAPLVPLFHAAMAADLPKPIAVLNIGGIANITWVGEDGDILAFDTGVGNVLLNEWLGKHTGTHVDLDGKTASKGTVDDAVLNIYLQDPFFEKAPPKSIDRNYFHISPVRHLSLENGAATLAAFTVRSIVEAQKHFPAPVKSWIIAGGGRHNPTIMQRLCAELPNVHSAEEANWDGDALEAQAFGFLAIRSLLGLPLSLPTTTGASRAVTGGALWRV
jgi:anhydro-N-acetylmuramic acid kinase